MRLEHKEDESCFVNKARHELVYSSLLIFVATFELFLLDSTHHLAKCEIPMRISEGDHAANPRTR